MMNLLAPRILLCLSALLVFESSVSAFFVDGSGHYAVKARKRRSLPMTRNWIQKRGWFRVYVLVRISKKRKNELQCLN